MSARATLQTLGSLLATLLILEAALRLGYGLTDRLPPHPDRSLTREWEWAAEHLKKDASEIPGLAGFDPLLGWRDTRDDTTWIRDAGYQTGNVVPGVPPRGARTLFIGDSFTAGLYVDPTQAFPYRYGEAFLADGETVNLGVSGYGVDQMLLLYEHLGRRLHADTVVLGFYTGGYDRTQSGFTYYAKPFFTLTAGDQLHLRGQPVPSPATLFAAYRTGERQVGDAAGTLLGRTFTAALARWHENRRLDGPDDPRWRLMAAFLDRFATLTRADHARPVLLIIPTRPERFADSREADFDRLAMASACDKGILPVSLAAPFAAALDRNPVEPLYRPREAGGHFTAQGHWLAARVLHDALAAPASSCQHVTPG
ncbi:MAG: SGNH/GDSL hydrolase family protein [Pseudomonadales bacterium]